LGEELEAQRLDRLVTRICRAWKKIMGKTLDRTHVRENLQTLSEWEAGFKRRAVTSTQETL
jgi:hypothetical protein